MKICHKFNQAVGFAALCLLFTPPVAAQLEQIMEELEVHGQARVIIRMKESAQGGSWMEAGSTAEQRGAVRAMQARMATALSEHDLVIQETYSSLPFISVTLDPERLGAIMSLPEVEGIYPVRHERKARITEKSQLMRSTISIDVSDSWDSGYEGAEYTVAVIDGGIDAGHPMLADKMVGDACFSATYTSTSGVQSWSQCPGMVTPQIASGAASNCVSSSGRCDHGTHVASIAVGNDGSTFGVARAAQLMPIDVFSRVNSEEECFPDPAPCELTDSLAVLDALNYVNEEAEDFNIVAVNLSLGGGENAGPCDQDDVRTAVINMLRNKGIATVAAAGNAGLNGSINAPACVSSAIAVGATTNSASVADFSNFASFMDVMAPGVAVKAAQAGGGFVERSGTSVATPYVAGAFAVIRSALPDATVDEILGALTESGVPVMRSSQNFSLPLIQVYKAILELQGFNVSVFSNVLGSTTPEPGQSFVRFHNSSSKQGSVRVSIRDAETGEKLGRWVSPVIPAHASVQFSISQLEREASAEQVIATNQRTYYNLSVESDFKGSMQHVLWQEIAGVISNMTSCADGAEDGKRALFNVHGPAIQKYPSLVRLYNDGTELNRAFLDIFNAASGQLIGKWTSNQLEAGAALEISMIDLLDQLNNDLESSDTTSNDDSTLPTHFNVELHDGFKGQLQHVVRNIEAQVLTDMSTNCTLE
ncbi:MAG: S8 family peptidase [Rhodospirillaceae bacterium]